MGYLLQLIRRYPGYRWTFSYDVRLQSYRIRAVGDNNRTIERLVSETEIQFAIIDVLDLAIKKMVRDLQLGV